MHEMPPDLIVSLGPFNARAGGKGTDAMDRSREGFARNHLPLASRARKMKLATAIVFVTVCQASTVFLVLMEDL